MDARPRVYFHTFGCKANQYDTERMRQEAEAFGAVPVPRDAPADVCLVNTCTVTNQADAEARRFIRRLRREKPGVRIVVAGCSAALRAGEYRSMDGVLGVVEGHDPVVVAQALVSAAEGTRPTPQPPGAGTATLAPAGSGAAGPVDPRPQTWSRPVALELRSPLDRLDTEPVAGALLRERRGHARGWLKVQDGCDRRCSFCATRLARGASRSRPPEDVVREAALLARHHAELVITGIHIGHYGRDLEGDWSLARLVALLLERVPGTRFRLGSVEATEVDDLLVALLAEAGGRLAPHLHMPLQSGSDRVLRRMRRWHTREQYRTRVLQIRDRLTGPLGLGADVIAGFPGETEEDHADTRALLQELPFTYLHVFPFSPRAGTPAAAAADPVPQRIAGRRARELRELAAERGRAYRGARVGQQARVVVEGDGGTALTEDYLRVGVAPGAASPGRLRDGTLQGSADHLYIAWPREDPLNP